MQQFGVLSLGSRLKRLSDHLYNEVQEIYLARSLAISSTYFPILRLLQTQSELSVVEVAEQLGLSHPAVSKQVSKMIKESLLVKHLDHHDQRRSIIALSPFCQQEMLKVEPVLQAIGAELDYYLSGLTGDFLTQLGALEDKLLTQHYAARVLLRLSPLDMTIDKMDSEADAASFRALNWQWLERYFSDHIYEQDRQMLDHPEQYVRDGAIVKLARFRDQVIGGYLLKPLQDDAMELCKLAVSDEFVCLGVGYRLLCNAIDEARLQGAKYVTLETHTSLVKAIRLYQKLGFEKVDTNTFCVPRANLKMIYTIDQRTAI